MGGIKDLLVELADLKHENEQLRATELGHKGEVKALSHRIADLENMLIVKRRKK